MICLFHKYEVIYKGKAELVHSSDKYFSGSYRTDIMNWSEDVFFDIHKCKKCGKTRGFYLSKKGRKKLDDFNLRNLLYEAGKL